MFIFEKKIKFFSEYPPRTRDRYLQTGFCLEMPLMHCKVIWIGANIIEIM